MAVTYDFTPKATGIASVGGNNVVGTLESVVQLKAFVIGLDSASDGTDDAPIDLRAVDGAHGSLYDLILRELAPLMAFAPDGATGVLHVIMDGHAVDAASIKARLVQLVGVGSDTTVTLGTSITVA
jgi:hypothetical protein